ncbi:PAS domain-containing protein [Cereibacter azotoformans]|uniref:histidine kinase n=1 Tax=Cereibacter sphaeroides (strain ATCC 17025 / ATH 2.4.3) TaxID=349102 RepID=A4WYR6_CERS5|nr:PAS domain-containing protein [Cereibacter azotoformans]ULB11986.1 PAS domain-containing protein [Cereibacter azotoformans]
MDEGRVQERLRDLGEAELGLGRWRWDLRRQSLTWSAEQREIYGLAPDAPEPGVLQFFQMIHPEDRDRLFAAVGEFLTHRKTRQSHSFRIIRADGSIGRILSHGRLILGADGAAIGITGIDVELPGAEGDEAAGHLEPAQVHVSTRLAGLTTRDEQDALLRVALGAGRMTVWQLDLVRRVVQLGGDAARLFGVQNLPREIPAALFETRVDAADLPALRNAEAAALRGEPMQVELRLTLAGGGHRWLRLVGETQRDRDGQPERIVGVAYDISARKRAEAQLRESEEHYRDVFSAIDEGFCICEMVTDAAGEPIDYRFLEANPLFESMTGLSNPMGRTALELVPDLERHWIETYARVGLGRETLRFELPSDAMGRWFNVFATPLSAHGRFAMVFKDVTERRRSEEALRESEAMFRTVTSTMPQIVWSAQPGGQVDFLNQRWTDVTGAPARPADGEGWHAFFHPGDRAEMDLRWKQALATGEPYEIEHRLRHRDGCYRWMLGRALPVRDAEGRILRWMGSCTDIHDMKLAQQRRQLLLEEMDHRVKNILALVQAVARQSFGGIPEAAKARDAFYGRLQALAGAYSHLRHESWAQASLRQIIGTSVAGCGANAEAVTLDGPDVMLPPRSAVPLSMAVHELCTNAMKYGALSAREGRVTIRWTQLPDARLHLVWAEADGPHVVPPSRAGFGVRMIETVLAAEVAGTVKLDFRPEGVRCDIEIAMPAPEVPSAGAPPLSA